MGNKQVSPIEHALFVYNSFTTELQCSNKISASDEENFFNHKFNLFLEDFIVNNNEFQVFKERGDNAIYCIGTLLLVHSLAIEMTFKNKKFQWKPGKLCQKWADGMTTRDVLFDLFSLYFVIMNDGFAKQNHDGKFYKWETLSSHWIPCEEDNVRLIEDFIDDFNINIVSCDFDSEWTERGRMWIQEKLNECINLIPLLNENRHDFISLIRRKHQVIFNKSQTEISCHSFVVNIANGSITPHSMMDLFSIYLPYDPIKETTNLVSSFIHKISCSPNEIATTILRWGCRTEPSITLIIGPPSSGKTTLIEIAQVLYGSFATCETTHKSDIVDYDLVRTCFNDNESLLNDKNLIKNHPCRHLVFTCLDDPKIGNTFGDRTVHYLKFNNSIDIHNRIPNITTKLSTRKQLGSLLGWCLANYDPATCLSHKIPINENFNYDENSDDMDTNSSSESTSEEEFEDENNVQEQNQRSMKIFKIATNGCEDLSSLNDYFDIDSIVGFSNSDSDMQQNDNVLSSTIHDEMSHSKIFRIGANGITEVFH